MVVLDDVIKEIAYEQYDEQDSKKELDNLYSLLDNVQKNEISSREELNDFLKKIKNFEKKDYKTGLYMSEKSSLMLTKFIFENCLDEKIRYDQRIINSIFNNDFITYELKRNYYHDNLRKALKEMYSYTLMYPELLAEILANHLTLCTQEEFENAYESFVPEKLQDDPRFIREFCRVRPSLIHKLLKFKKIDKDLACQIVKENIRKRIYYEQLPDYIKEYIEENRLDPVRPLEKVKDKVKFLSESFKSDLYKKLYFRYGRSFHEKYKNHEKKDDKVFFMYNMLTSNVLERIYAENIYTKNDIDFISSFLNMLEVYDEFKNDYPTERIREAMDFYRKKHAMISTEIYNAFVVNKTNDDAIQKLTQKIGITRDNAFNYVKTQKYWDKNQKEFILTVLSGYFKLGNVITIYDIIDLLEEMSERQLTKEEILAEKNIDVKYFEKICENVRELNPPLYELIRNKFKENSLRGFKKLLLLYHSVMSSKIKDRDQFMEKYNKTPEEVLDMFKNTEFYDDIHTKLSEWYDFPQDDINKQSGVAM